MDYCMSEYQETGVPRISRKVIEETEKSSTLENMEKVNTVKRLLGTSKLTTVVGDDGMGIFAAHSAY
jgi:hypothetical protein